MTLLDLWTSDASFNKVDFSNHRYDGLIAGAKAEPDAARRMNTMAEAERLVGGSATLAPIYYFASASVTKPYVKNYVVYPYGPASDYKHTSIEV
jgi:oligopeptide transport system substrate-binding protein